MVRRLLRKFNNCRLRTKLLVSYAGLVVILLVFWGVSAYYQINSQLAYNAKSDLHSTFSFAQLLLENKMARAERALSLIAEDPGVSNTFSTANLSDYQQAQGILERFDPLLSNINQQNEYIAQVMVYTYYDLKNSRNYIRDAATVSGVEAEYLNCGSEPRWLFDGTYLTISGKSVNIDQPQYAATITFQIDPQEFFGECLQSQTLDYIFSVYDDRGQPVFTKESIQNADAWQEGSPYLLEETVTLSKTGWQISLRANAQTLMVSANTTLRTTVAAVAIALVLIIPLIFVLSSSFSKRVRVLKEQVAQIVPENYEMDISSEEKDEIGEITNAVGGMVKDTRKVILESYRAKIARRDAQIQALQAQINPHFLYNTLSNLNWRAIAKADIETSNILTALSRFYRLSLNNGHTTTTVAQELEHVKIYMKIQSAIHQSPLMEERYEVDEDLLDYNMPSIILQPIVENALEHGIGAIGFENGRLHISVQRENARIVFRIADNGPGIKPEIAATVFNEEGGSVGYGLRNVYRRLHLFFDDQCALRFEETPGGGSTVVLEIPPYVQP